MRVEAHQHPEVTPAPLPVDLATAIGRGEAGLLQSGGWGGGRGRVLQTRTFVCAHTARIWRRRMGWHRTRGKVPWQSHGAASPGYTR